MRVTGYGLWWRDGASDDVDENRGLVKNHNPRPWYSSSWASGGCVARGEQRGGPAG